MHPRSGHTVGRSRIIRKGEVEKIGLGLRGRQRGHPAHAPTSLIYRFPLTLLQPLRAKWHDRNSRSLVNYKRQALAMRIHRLIAIVLIAIVAFGCRITPTHAGSPYSALYAFGDSLSDVGNVFAASVGKEPAPPYFQGRFSNGPIWLDYLAERLRTGPMIPSELGGKNYAFGSATTGYAPTLSNPSLVPTFAQQVVLFKAATHGVAPSSALYTVWIGGEDLLNVLQSVVTGAQALALMRGAAATRDHRDWGAYSPGCAEFFGGVAP
jgi:hypothetical protein